MVEVDPKRFGDWCENVAGTRLAKVSTERDSWKRIADKAQRQLRKANRLLEGIGDFTSEEEVKLDVDAYFDALNATENNNDQP